MIFISITIHLVRHIVFLNNYVVKTFSHLATRPGHNHLLSSSGDCGDEGDGGDGGVGGEEIGGDAGGESVNAGDLKVAQTGSLRSRTSSWAAALKNFPVCNCD